MIVDKVIFTKNGMDRFNTALELALVSVPKDYINCSADKICTTEYLRGDHFNGTLYTFNHNDDVVVSCEDSENFTTFTIKISTDDGVNFNAYIDIDRHDIISMIVDY